MVGAVLALTVNTKFVEAVSVPSLTVIVMVEVPLWPAAGVMTTLRLAPVPPPKVMLAFGTNVAFDEVPETVNPVGCVSASPIVKAIGPVGVFSFVDCGAIAVMVGAVFAFTVNTKFVEAVRLPSLTVIVMVEVPLWPAAGVMTRLRLAPVPPPKVMLAFGTNVAFDEVPETVNPVGCVSASPIVKAIGPVGVFSFVDCGAMAVMVGGVLAALTVRTKLVEAVSVPSLTVIVMVEVPLWPAAGVMTTLRLAPVPPPKVMLAFGTNVAFDEVPETVNPVGCVSASPIVKAIGPVGVFSFVDCGAIAVMVGAVFAFTVNTKFVEAVRLPSLTVIVMVEVPLWPAAGVMTRLRLAPVPPPKVMLAFGTNVAFDEVPETVNPVGCVSASPIVKAIGPVGVFSFVDCGAMAVMVGGVLAALTVRTKLVEAVSVPSLTVTVIVEVPLWPAAGVMTRLRLASVPPPKVMLAFGTNVTFDEVPETVNPVGCVSASPMVNAIGPVGVFSFVDCGAIAVMVGAVLALTVNTKFVEAVRLPSLTVIVMVEVPLWPAAGVMTTLRLAPVPPPKVMLAFGTNVAFDEVPETVNPVGCVSASPIVKAIGPVGVFSFVDCGAMAVMVGGVLAALTVRTKLVEAVSVPSLTVTVIVEVPLWPAAGVMTRLRLAPVPPPKVMLAFGTNVAFDEVPETVNPVGCVSASPMVNAIGEVGVFSFVDCGAMAVMVGGVLAALTVRTKLVEAVSVPSLTVTVIVEVPLWPAAGVMTRLRLAPVPPKVMLAFGTNVAFDEVPETVNPVGCVSASPMVNAIGEVGVFSFVDCGAMAVMVGGVLAALTVRTKLVEAVSVPSLTVTVIVEVPLWPAAGVMTRLRLASVPPPKVMLAFGTNVTFDEVPETVNPVGCVSASPMVNAIGEVGVFSFVDCGAIAVMVGAVLALTVNTKLVEAVSVPSLTVTVMVEVPLSPAAGVMTTLRLAPVPPPKVMLAFGTKVAFDEVPETVNPVG